MTRTLYTAVAFFLTAFSLCAQIELLPITAEQLAPRGSARAEYTSNGIILQLDKTQENLLAIRPPNGAKYWNLTTHYALCADVTNLSSDRQARLNLILPTGNRKDKTYREANSGIALNPGETRAIRLLLPHKHLYAAPADAAGPRTIPTDQIPSIEFHLQWPFEPAQPGLVNVRISNIRLLNPIPADAAPIPAERYLPFVDIYGQYIHADWPQKIHTDADLTKALATEQPLLDSARAPSDWNQYGGWATGPQFKATGHFRTAKYQGKWHLIDPSGAIFYSLGIDVLHAHTDATDAKRHPTWYAAPQTPDGCHPYTHWNLQKKYGQTNYHARYYQNLNKRLRAWGINTIGNWGASAYIQQANIPYTLQLSDHNPKLPRLQGSKLKFYDVYHPDYTNAISTLLTRRAQQDPLTQKSITDPLCIGYFIDNELDFGNRNGLVYNQDLHKTPATQPAKLHYIQQLTQKYTTIDALNQAWQTTYTSWDNLLTSTNVPPAIDAQKADAAQNHQDAVDQYFRLCRNAIKTVAPHRLYLGTRFVGTDAVRTPLYLASAKYCDVLTANLYAHTPANYPAGTGSAHAYAPDYPDMPVLIGEFHFGIRDRGLFSASLCPAGLTQAERATAYTRYAQGALLHPNIVGIHWFQYRDQPLTGRWDGEGYQLGYVDVADTPYPDLIQATRHIAETMYPTRSTGKLPAPSNP